MIVDIGGGTTEVAVIALGGIVTCKSLRIAGDELDQAIITYIKKEFNLMIGERTAETVKIELASAFDTGENKVMDIKGRDLVTGLPKTIEINENQIREAIKEPIYSIIDAIKTTLEKTPPELSADIMERGIMLAGGGALLHNLDKLINRGDGLETRYGHLNSFLVDKGVKVEKGDIIGKSGNTGKVTGPHLHFSLSVMGTYKNPEEYINFKE